MKKRYEPIASMDAVDVGDPDLVDDYVPIRTYRRRINTEYVPTYIEPQQQYIPVPQEPEEHKPQQFKPKQNPTNGLLGRLLRNSADMTKAHGGKKLIIAGSSRRK